jgi:hypothetical protein
MQFEAVKPARRTFPSFCCFSENFMLKYPFVVANGYFGGINKGNPGAFVETDGVWKKHHRYKTARLQLNKSAV